MYLTQSISSTCGNVSAIWHAGMCNSTTPSADIRSCCGALGCGIGQEDLLTSIVGSDATCPYGTKLGNVNMYDIYDSCDPVTYQSTVAQQYNANFLEELGLPGTSTSEMCVGGLCACFSGFNEPNAEYLNQASVRCLVGPVLE